MSAEPSLAGRTILLGVSGSIAAYKAADLCSRLGKLGADVHVVLTPSAARFVGEATFRALTRNPVHCDVFDEPTARRIAHIDLAQSADLVLIAPASANLLARMANGFANDMLTTCLLATPASTPLLVAPAMNTVMWEHPATIANVALLQERHVEFIAPVSGLLACQDTGTGKLADQDDIIAAVVARLAVQKAANQLQNALSPPFSDQNISASTCTDPKFSNLSNKRLLITAGATREPLDPVRFLSNRSSGKMGYALAQQAIERGAQVTLVSGFATAPVPVDCTLISVQTAQEMLDACQACFEATDVFISAAAVADYAPVTVQPHKIKKSTLSPSSTRIDTTDSELNGKDLNGEGANEEHQNCNAADEEEEIISLLLKRTPDVVATIARQKRHDQVVVGFAAETQDLLVYARAKMERKRLDMIVANDVLAEGAGFETATNIITLLWPDGRVLALPKAPKTEVANCILDAISHLIENTSHSK